MAIFQGQPGLAGFTEAKDDGTGGDNWTYKSCKAPVSHHQQTNTQLFPGRMSFLSPNQQCQSAEGKRRKQAETGRSEAVSTEPGHTVIIYQFPAELAAANRLLTSVPVQAELEVVVINWSSRLAAPRDDPTAAGRS